MSSTTTVPLRLSLERHGTILVLRASGEIGALTAPSLLATVVATLDGGDDEIRLDLSAVRSVDAAGLDALQRCQDLLARRARRFSVVRPSQPVRAVIDLAGAERLLRDDA